MDHSEQNITLPFADAVIEIGQKYGLTSENKVAWKAFCLMVEFQGNHKAALKKADQQDMEEVSVFLFEQGSNGRLRAACEEVLRRMPNCPWCGDGPA